MNKLEEINEQLAEMEENAITADGFDDAILGIETSIFTNTQWLGSRENPYARIKTKATVLPITPSKVNIFTKTYYLNVSVLYQYCI